MNEGREYSVALTADSGRIVFGVWSDGFFGGNHRLPLSAYSPSRFKMSAVPSKKVLLLHGWAQNGFVMKSRTKKLQK